MKRSPLILPPLVFFVLSIISCQPPGGSPVTIDGSTQERFDESVEDLRATLSVQDAERFQEIYLARLARGHGRVQMHGQTAEDFLDLWRAREEISRELNQILEKIDTLGKIPPSEVTDADLAALEAARKRMEELQASARQLYR